jgi:hypothetical protein
MRIDQLRRIILARIAQGQENVWISTVKVMIYILDIKLKKCIALKEKKYKDFKDITIF